MLDLPNHLARIFVLRHLSDPQYIFSRYFRSDWGPYPYVGMDACLLALSRVMPLQTAAKVFGGLTVLALPASVWWLLRRAGIADRTPVLFAALLSYEEFFLEGFLAFQAGLALCFFAAGVWLWYRERPGAARWCATLAVVMALYFMHLIAFAICGAIICIHALASRLRWKDVVFSGLLFVPGAALFWRVKTAISANHDVYIRGWADKLRLLVDVPFHGYSMVGDRVTKWGIAACIVIAVAGNRELRIRLPWAAALAFLLLTYFLLPYAWGDTFDIDLRFVPAAFILMLLAADCGRRARPLAAVAAALLAAKLVISAAGMRERSQLLEGARTGIERIDRNARVLPMVHAPDEQDVLDRQYIHYADYAMPRRGAFVPYLFDIPGQMPLRCDPCLPAPDDFWNLDYTTAPDWHEIRQEYDYVWAWDVTKFDSDLRKFAEPVYATGLLRLYKVRR
ncbi:MAG: hypothetical protein JO041_08830 [Acidobacteria bacterium]|nr:hypothetical protein [Acidobacteriota bacterium]